MKGFLKSLLLLGCLSGQIISVTYAEEESLRPQNEPITPIPLVNGLDVKKVALGKRLFHDVNLSADGTISCASCHALTNSGVDSREVSVGVKGLKARRNTPTVLNSSLLYRQFWDARVTALEEQVSTSLTNSVELAGNWDNVLDYLRSTSSYQNDFVDSYGESGVTKKTVSHAIAEFERSLLTPNGAFDRYLKGDDRAIDLATKRGYQLFKSFGCASCHQGRAVGGNFSAKLGVIFPYFKEEVGVEQDLGRYDLNGLEDDKFKVKVPSLRNVARTAPYLHDGSVETLEEVVKVMAKYQIGRNVTEKETSEIVKFLRSLNGEIYAN